MLTPVSLPDLNPIPEPTLIPIPVEFEHEPLILDSHIPLLGNECELQFYDLDQTHEPTPTLKPKLNLSFISESISVPIPFIVEPKSSIPQNHIPLLGKDIDHNDSEMIFQDCHIKGIIFTIEFCMILFILGSIKMLIGKRS